MMVVLNCTQKLLRRFPHTLENNTSSTTILGAWSANVFNVGRISCIIVTNEQTLLTVVVPYKEVVTFGEHAILAIHNLLISIGISESHVVREVKEMQVIKLSKGTTRQMTGSMNDFARLIKAYKEYHPDYTNDKIDLYLSNVPCGPLKMGIPKEKVIQIFHNIFHSI